MHSYATDPGVMSTFTELHEFFGETGALDIKTNKLLALANAIATRCEGCITFQVHDALALEATRDLIIEVVGVAVCIGPITRPACGTQAAPTGIPLTSQAVGRTRCLTCPESAAARRRLSRSYEPGTQSACTWPHTRVGYLLCKL